MRVPTPLACRPPSGILLRIVFVLSLVLAGSLRVAPVAWAAEGDAGYRGFSYGTKPVPAPTSEKPESKLWWNDGSWWGSLFDPISEDYHIFRLDVATQQWVDTGTRLDDRNSSLADTLWDDTTNKLYVVSHLFTTDGQPSTTVGQWGRLYRYSYNATMDQYSLDSGFPVTVTKGKSETLVVAKDSTGQLWVTYVESGKVMLNRSLGDDATWGEPFVLPVVKAESVNVTADDISSVLAFQGNKLGVMWSNQLTQKIHFAAHLDSEADEVWQAEQTALPGPKNCKDAEPCADDHINLKSVQADGTGRVFAAIKTSHTAPNAPLVMLLVRDLAGNWDDHVFGRKSDNHTRPMVLLDEEHGTIYMFATAPEASGAIYYKTTPITNIAFPPGRGDVFIQSSTDIKINNVTSTKQNLNSTTGLVVLAADNTTYYYFHNYLSLTRSPPAADAGSTLPFQIYIPLISR